MTTPQSTAPRKVVILCGGKGTRFGEVTGNLLPKPMVAVGEQPIVWHIMRHNARFGHRGDRVIDWAESQPDRIAPSPAGSW